MNNADDADNKNDKLYAEVKDKPETHNENLEGGKSSSAPMAEAKEDQSCASNQKTEREPEEVKAAQELLPEDTQRKVHNSES